MYDMTVIQGLLGKTLPDTKSTAIAGKGQNGQQSFMNMLLGNMQTGSAAMALSEIKIPVMEMLGETAGNQGDAVETANPADLMIMMSQLMGLGTLNNHEQGNNAATILNPLSAGNPTLNSSEEQVMTALFTGEKVSQEKANGMTGMQHVYEQLGILNKAFLGEIASSSIDSAKNANLNASDGQNGSSESSLNMMLQSSNNAIGSADKMTLQNQGFENMGVSAEFSAISELDANNAMSAEKVLPELAVKELSFEKPFDVASIKQESTEAYQSPRIYAQVAEQIAKNIQGGKANEITMQLYPETLGKIDIKMALKGGRLAIDIIAASNETHRLLVNQAENLVRALGLSNVEVSQVNVVNTNMGSQGSENSAQSSLLNNQNMGETAGQGNEQSGDDDKNQSAKAKSGNTFQHFGEEQDMAETVEILRSNAYRLNYFA